MPDRRNVRVHRVECIGNIIAVEKRGRNIAFPVECVFPAKYSACRKSYDSNIVFVDSVCLGMIANIPYRTGKVKCAFGLAVRT